TECDTGIVGRDARRQGIGTEVRDLVLVSAVIIHRPDLSMPTVVADVINPGFSYSLTPATQAEDNFIGKPVGDYAHCLSAGSVLVLLAKNRRRSAVLDVIEPALRSDVVARDTQIAEYEHGSVWRGSVPGIELDVGRLTRLLQRIKTLRHQVEDPGVIQVIPERVIECLEEVGILGIVGGSFEIRHRQADLLHGQAGSRADPILLCETWNR